MTVKAARALIGSLLAAVTLWSLAWGIARAQPVGEVEFARGVGFAQAPSQAPRTLGPGLALQVGDTISTAEGALAIIKFHDGTKLTVRPNSQLVLQQFQFQNNPANDNMLLQLLRGGLRAVTGLVTKGSPNAARLQTPTATIGLRGTDFDARLCTRDCAAESARVAEPARPNIAQASARVLQLRGELNASDASGQRRRLVQGASVYPGDLLETGAQAQAVLVFRDESRVSLGAATRFRVDQFVFDANNAREGQFLVSLLRGSLRALTGLIAKANTRNVTLTTATATIGVRGTGWDVVCTGACAGEPGAGPDDGLTLYAWLGSIVVSPSGQTALQALEAGQGLLITPSGIRPLPAPPNLQTPRPDQLSVPGNLFSSAGGAEEEGLYVLVRDGHIEITSASGSLHLGRGESGFAATDGRLGRPESIPKFLDFDWLPLPGSRNPLLTSILGEARERVLNQCR